MSLIEAIILGIIQGLTEFLPVSSSGHIEIGKALFGIQEEEGLLFTVLLHFATALSTLFVFRKDIVELFQGLLKFKWNDETQYAVKIVLSMIPAVLVAILFNDQIESLFDSNIPLVGSMLIVTGIILFASDRMKQVEGRVTYGKSILIGIVQAIAIMPGISRSGSTIGSSVLMGISREKAARFSFLMVLPLIFGAMAKEVMDREPGSAILDIDMKLAVAGFLAAFISGYFACRWMIAIVKRARLSYFAWYCFLAGIIALIVGLV